MNRISNHDKNWGPFTLAPWKNRFSIEYSSGGGEENGPDKRNFFMIVAFGWALRIALPQIIKPWKNPKYDHDYHRKDYGISLTNLNGQGYDWLSIDYGPQTMDSETTKSWGKHLPWKAWDCVRHSMYYPDGVHYFTEPTEGDRQTIWDSYWAARERRPMLHFAIDDCDGKRRKASCHIEEREWRIGRGFWKFLRLFNKPHVRRDCSFEFDYEVGPEKGSWKGGLCATGIEMKPGETMQQAFRRWCSMEHNARGGRKYKVCFLCQCGPPEPRDIRVARNRGWTNCPDDNGLWHHDECVLCQDGHYLTTDQMLEFIEKQNSEQYGQTAVNSGAILS